MSDDGFIAKLGRPRYRPVDHAERLALALRRRCSCCPGWPLRKAMPPTRIASIICRVEQEVLDIAEKWRPFRSLATSYLLRPR